MIDLNEALDLAKQSCLKAGKFLLQNQKKVIVNRSKSDSLDIQTDLDLKSEDIIIKSIKTRFPNHSILSEEQGHINQNSEYTWVIDPLDGTKEFVRKIPDYFVNISLEINKELMLGASYNPNNNCLYYCLRDHGAYLNDSQIKVSMNDNLADSFIYTHLPDRRMDKPKFKSSWESLKRIAESCYRLRGIGADLKSLSYVALGGIDGYILFTSSNWGPKWWDISTGILMVQEADGIVTDTLGRKIMNRDLSNGVVAGNKFIHEKLIELIK